MLLGVSLVTGASPVAAQEGNNGQLHIVKDCGIPTNPPNTCQILHSNLSALPAGSLIYYDQVTGGPSMPPAIWTAMSWSTSSPASGPSRGAPWQMTPRRESALLSDGVGPLAGITVRVNVTYTPGGDGALFTWDGTLTGRDHVAIETRENPLPLTNLLICFRIAPGSRANKKLDGAPRVGISSSCLPTFHSEDTLAGANDRLRAKSTALLRYPHATARQG